MSMVNFSLFVNSWRSRFLTGRQQWHSHYRGLLLGYRANTTTIKLYYQVSQLQVGLHLVRAIFARGGQCWGFGISPQRAQTAYGYFFARWLPGHLSNNWFVVDQNNYRRQMYIRLRGGSQAYLSGNLEFNYQALDLELVRDRIIYRLTSSLRVRLGHIRRTKFVDQLFRWSSTEQQRLSLRGLGRKTRSHPVQQISKLNSSNLFVRKFLQRARRRQKLIQNKLNSKVKLNFLTTFVQQRLSAKYLLRARLLFNQSTTLGLGWWPFKTSFNFSRYLRFTFLYRAHFFNFLYKFKRFTLFNHQLELLRYFLTRSVRRRHLKTRKSKRILFNGLRLLSRFYRWSTKEQPVTLHHNRARAYRLGASTTRRPGRVSTFFVWLPPTAVEERRRRQRVRRFNPPPHLRPMLSIYLARLEREALYRDSLRESRYRQKFAPTVVGRRASKPRIKKTRPRRLTRWRQNRINFCRWVRACQARTRLVLLVRGCLLKHLRLSEKGVTNWRRELTPFFNLEEQTTPVEPIWIPENPDDKHDLFRAEPVPIRTDIPPFLTPRTPIQRFLTVFKSYPPHRVGLGLTQEVLQVGQKTAHILPRRSSFFYGLHFRYCSYFRLIRRQTQINAIRRTKNWLKEYKKEQLRLIKKKEAQKQAQNTCLIKLRSSNESTVELQTTPVEKPSPDLKLVKKPKPTKKPTKKLFKKSTKKFKPKLVKKRPHLDGTIFVRELQIQNPTLFHRVLKLSSSSSRRVKRVFNFSAYHQNYYTFKSVTYGYSSLVRQRWRAQPFLFAARRARRATWFRSQQFTFKPVSTRLDHYRWQPRTETLTHNRGQLQLRLFPAVVVGGLLQGKLGSLASEVANLNLPFIYLYTTSVAPYVASYGVIWNGNGHSRRGMAVLVHHLYRYTTFGTLLQMFLRRLEL